MLGLFFIVAWFVYFAGLFCVFVWLAPQMNRYYRTLLDKDPSYSGVEAGLFQNKQYVLARYLFLKTYLNVKDSEFIAESMTLRTRFVWSTLASIVFVVATFLFGLIERIGPQSL